MSDINQPMRKDKHWHIGDLWIKYVHYYPQKWSPAQWGFSTWKFKGFNIDFYFGKHVIVFTFTRWI